VLYAEDGSIASSYKEKRSCQHNDDSKGEQEKPFLPEVCQMTQFFVWFFYQSRLHFIDNEGPYACMCRVSGLIYIPLCTFETRDELPVCPGLFYSHGDVIPTSFLLMKHWVARKTHLKKTKLQAIFTVELITF
jgi:hypothetical protein